MGNNIKYTLQDILELKDEAPKLEVHQLKQSEAVYLVVSRISNETGVSIKEMMDKENKHPEKKAALRQCSKLLYNMFINDEIVLNVKYSDSKLRKYCSSLIRNQFKYDKRYLKHL